jgi:hypothetical protein
MNSRQAIALAISGQVAAAVDVAERQPVGEGHRGRGIEVGVDHRTGPGIAAERQDIRIEAAAEDHRVAPHPVPRRIADVGPGHFVGGDQRVDDCGVEPRLVAHQEHGGGEFVPHRVEAGDHRTALAVAIGTVDDGAAAAAVEKVGQRGPNPGALMAEDDDDSLQPRGQRRGHHVPDQRQAIQGREQLVIAEPPRQPGGEDDTGDVRSAKIRGRCRH